VRHTQITIETVDGTTPSYETRPDEEAGGSILVIQRGLRGDLPYRRCRPPAVRGRLAIDVSAAFDHLERSGFAPTEIGVVGFCMGGSVTF
jgi:hypothetical protein